MKQFSIEKGKLGTGEVALVKDMIMLKDLDKVKSISATAVGIDDEFGLLKGCNSIRAKNKTMETVNIKFI